MHPDRRHSDDNLYCGASALSRRHTGFMGLSGEAKLGIGASVVIAFLAASSAPWWWHDLPWNHAKQGPPPGVVGFSGGCDAFQVFAQNRWDPVGTVVRAQPNVISKQVGGFGPNQSIPVNGWVHGRPAYPTNTSPWNSDIWFHVADDSGWVSFPGVRATPVAHDPTGLSSYGGNPAATAAGCQGSVQ